jgi:hypothetical protein
MARSTENKEKGAGVTLRHPQSPNAQDQYTDSCLGPRTHPAINRGTRESDCFVFFILCLCDVTFCVEKQTAVCRYRPKLLGDGRVVLLSIIDRSRSLFQAMRDTHLNGTGAGTTLTVLGGEENFIDTAVTYTVPL